MEEGMEAVEYDNVHNETQDKPEKPKKSDKKAEELKIDMENRDPNDLNPQLRVCSWFSTC